MTAEDLLALAPWLVFIAALAVIGWRLLAHRRPRRRPGPSLAARARTGRRQAPGHRRRQAARAEAGRNADR